MHDSLVFGCASTSPRLRRRGVFALSLLATCLLGAVAVRAAGADLRTIILHGEQAPGTPDGVTFRVNDGVSPHFLPVINAWGQVSFGSLLQGPNVDTGNALGIWTESTDAGPVRLIARQGSIAPGVGPGVTFANVGSRHFGHSLTDRGETIFEEIDVGPSGGLATPIAAWRDAGNGPQVIARADRQVPGQAPGVTYGSINLTSVGTHGHVSWSSGMKGPGITTDNDFAAWIYRASPDSFAFVQREGPAPGTGDGVSARASGSDINRYGDVVTNGVLIGPGLGNGTTGAMFARRNGVLEKVIFERDAAPGLPSGSQFRDSGVAFPWSEPAINSLGMVAFRSLAYVPVGPIPTIETRSGIWMDSSRGLELVIETGTQAPGRPRGSRLFVERQAAINDLGQVMFQAEPSGVQSLPGVIARDVYRATHGHIERLLGSNDPVPGSPGWVFTGEFHRLTQNNHGQIAILAGLYHAQAGTGRNIGLFAMDRSGDLRPIAIIGDSLEVAPGDVRTVAAIDMATPDAPLNDITNADYFQGGFGDTGHIAFRAQFTDGSAGFFVSDKVAAKLFVSSGDVWKYRDNGVDLGSAWRQSAYDDSAWSMGQAQLGFGDGDETTLTSNGAGTPFTTTYFRKEFTVANPDEVETLSLDLLRDDGAIVYLNGVRVARDNLPAVVDASTFALTTAGNESERAWRHFGINPELLVPGRNVLAVEVHQAALASSDVSFDLRLYSGPTPIVDHGLKSNAPVATFQAAATGDRYYQRALEDSPDEIAFHADNGAVVSYLGDHAFEVNNANVSFATELIDVRHLRNAVARIDLRTWEDSTGSDFESDDEIEVFVETASGSVDLTQNVLVPRRVGGSGIGDPNDALKSLDRGQFGAFTTFSFALPEDTTSVRFLIRAVNNSASERFVFDNIRVTGTPIPEPSGCLLVISAAAVVLLRRPRCLAYLRSARLSTRPVAP